MVDLVCLDNLWNTTPPYLSYLIYMDSWPGYLVKTTCAHVFI